MQSVQLILLSLVSQIPIAVVCLGGIIWALLRFQQQPRAAMILLAGMGLYLLLGISQIFLQTPLMHLSGAYRTGDSGATFRLHSTAIGFGFNILRALSLGLMAYAAFVDRPVVAMPASQQPMR